MLSLLTTPCLLILMVSFCIGCTTIIVSRGASQEGSPMVTHTADCVECDVRIGLVPGRSYIGHQLNNTHISNAHPSSDVSSKEIMRPVYGNGHIFPREYSGRATIYVPSLENDRATPLGFVPETNETFGYWEGVYPMMNSEGLSIGESSVETRVPPVEGVDLKHPSDQRTVSTNHGKYIENIAEKNTLTSAEVGQTKALLCIKELIRMGMERCRTAICAITVIGEQTLTYGFYGETWGAGETLTLVDKRGDAWVMHLCSDSTGKSAIWAAQRVPDGHISMVANQYTIKTLPDYETMKINFNNSEKEMDFMYSSNMRSDALKMGLWDGKSPFSWVKAFSPGNAANLPTYSSLRMWYVYTRVAPTQDIQFIESPFDYPFSVKVDKKLKKEDLMDLHRSFYEDSPFDMTQGILSDRFHNPSRLEGGPGMIEVPGATARGISIQRTVYGMIGIPKTLKQNKSILYIAIDSPATGVYVPFLADTINEANFEDLENSANLYSNFYQKGNKQIFREARESAWWAFNLVANWMNINHRQMHNLHVKPKIIELQEKIKMELNMTTETCKDIQNYVVSEWWVLADTLIERYNDGYLNFPPDNPNECIKIGYDADYLRSIGFNENFIYPQFIKGGSSQRILNDTKSIGYTKNDIYEEDVEKKRETKDSGKNKNLDKKWTKNLLYYFSYGFIFLVGYCIGRIYSMTTPPQSLSGWYTSM